MPTYLQTSGACPPLPLGRANHNRLPRGRAPASGHASWASGWRRLEPALRRSSGAAAREETGSKAAKAQRESRWWRYPARAGESGGSPRRWTRVRSPVPHAPLAAADTLRSAASSGLHLEPPSAAPCVLAELGPALARRPTRDRRTNTGPRDRALGREGSIPSGGATIRFAIPGASVPPTSQGFCERPASAGRSSSVARLLSTHLSPLGCPPTCRVVVVGGFSLGALDPPLRPAPPCPPTCPSGGRGETIDRGAAGQPTAVGGIDRIGAVSSTASDSAHTRSNSMTLGAGSTASPLRSIRPASERLTIARSTSARSRRSRAHRRGPRESRRRGSASRRWSSTACSGGQADGRGSSVGEVLGAPVGCILPSCWFPGSQVPELFL